MRNTNRILLSLLGLLVLKRNKLKQMRRMFASKVNLLQGSGLGLELDSPCLRSRHCWVELGKLAKLL